MPDAALLLLFATSLPLLMYTYRLFPPAQLLHIQTFPRAGGSDRLIDGYPLYASPQ